MDENIYLSVIIPAYNEEKRIMATLEQVARYLLSKPWTSEIIIVSDGSNDRTVEVAKSFETRFPRIKILTLPENRGKGYAVKIGMLAGKGKLRLFLDADGSTPVGELEKLLVFIHTGTENVSGNGRYDVVIGSLAVAGAEVDKKQYILRVMAGKIGNILIQFLVLPGIKDTQRGFKLFTAEAAGKIFSNLTVARWGFDVEVLVLARKFNFSIKELPVYWSHSTGSKISPLAYIRTFFEVLGIWWRWRGLPAMLRIASWAGKNFSEMNHVDYCRQFLPAGGLVLDVGSGKGKFLRAMSERGFRATGIEVSQSYIQAAKNEAMTAGATIDLREGRAEELPFPDNNFDFVNCAEVSEHVDEPKKMCEEIWRVLKPGGRCYISFHNRFGFFDYHYGLYFINWLPRSWAERILKFLKKQKKDSIIGRQTLNTMHYYTYGRAIKLLEDVGFAVQDIRAMKIRERFGLLSLPVMCFYIIFARPLYFNSFHFLVGKP